MSTTCALMSTRPSSNTAKSPAGPPPMIRASVSMGAGVSAPSAVIKPSLARIGSELLLGNTDDEPVQRRRHLDLTGEPAFWPHFEGEVEHVLLHRLGCAGLLQPVAIDIDMTGRAGTGPP